MTNREKQSCVVSWWVIRNHWVEIDYIISICGALVFKYGKNEGDWRMMAIEEYVDKL